VEICKIKKKLLQYKFIFFFIKIYSEYYNNISIFKNENCYIHKIKKFYFINFHPVRNISSFFSAYKIFTNKYKPKKNDVIFDVGSGIGAELLLFSKAVGSRGIVICIEPDPRLIDVLKKIIKFNNLTNVKLYQNLFYNKNNVGLEFSLYPIHDWMSNKIKADKKNLICKTVTIDKIIKEHKILKIDFAKFNIEGAEKYLNYGNNNFLKMCKNIVISCHDFLKKEETNTHQIVLKILKKKYFKIIKNNSNNLIEKYFVYAKK